MFRFAIVLLLAFSPISIVRADDELLGQWVFPRSKDTPVLDRDDKVLMKWSESPGKVTWVGKDWIYIRHSQYPGPYEGHVRKTDVVKLDSAIQHYSKLIQQDKMNVWALSRRGEAWDQKYEYDEAIKDFNEAIRLDPSPSAYILRGTVWESKKEYDSAIKDFDEAIRLNPKDARAFNCRGNIWYDNKEYDKAVADYSKAIRLDSHYASAFSNRAYAWSGKKEFDKALKDSDEGLHLDPTDPDAFISRGNVWLDKEEYANAI